MSPPPGTIDLGELTHGEQPEIAAAWPVRARLRRWRGRRGWRLAGAAATTALVLAATGAADTRPQPPLTLEFTVQVTDFNMAYDSEHLYVVEDAGGPRQVTVTAYRLEDGMVRWQVPLPDSPNWLGLEGEALLVGTSPYLPDNGSPTDRTTLLDADSGDPLGTYDGSHAGEAGDYLLFRESIPGPEDEYPQQRLSAVDPVTGEPAWSLEVQRWSLDRRKAPTRLVTLDLQGTLASYDLTTGELMATVPTAASTTPEDPWFEGLQTIGSHVLVQEEVDGEVTINAYDVESLRWQWSLADATTDSAGQVIVWPAPCGDLVCLNQPDDVPRAIDPETGATVWSADWARTDAGTASYDAYDLGDGWLAGYALLSRFLEPDGDQQSWLIDMETGRPVMDLRQWSPAGAYSPFAVDSARLLTRTGEEGTWIGRLRPDLSGIDALGLIESVVAADNGIWGYCVPSGVRIVCMSEMPVNDEPSHVDVEVWRLR